MQDYKFYQKHLNQVSRSFAFCIEQLEDEIKLPVAHMYLVCRILDTIEDSQWPSPELRDQNFESFLNLFTNNTDINNWVQQFSGDVKPCELDLIKDTQYLVDDFYELDPKIQTIIIDLLDEMAAGMVSFRKAFEAKGEFRLSDMSELNKYCYFVAGIVGKALSRLVEVQFSLVTINQDMILNALHFGLFLQKINLLKDQFGDEKEGRYFIFNRLEVIQSLRSHAEASMQYILNIPEKYNGYRKFCAWSVFIALGSFKYIEQSHCNKSFIKISRLETKLLIALVNSVVDNNDLLFKFFTNYLNQNLPKIYLHRSKNINKITIKEKLPEVAF